MVKQGLTFAPNSHILNGTNENDMTADGRNVGQAAAKTRQRTHQHGLSIGQTAPTLAERKTIGALNAGLARKNICKLLMAPVKDADAEMAILLDRPQGLTCMVQAHQKARRHITHRGDGCGRGARQAPRTIGCNDMDCACDAAHCFPEISAGYGKNCGIGH